ncbi:hypothetical protein N7G274_001158 [Stereocaulon virgatum]|uniref:Mediator of RNA polymerase II transcription subunit 22 n=1 Tax=Stereocaulon virgatum TaxID=373712 RepID=A0ABR4ANM1_9LECA
MDPNQRTSNALLERSATDVAQLLRRFENIVAYTPDEGNDRNKAAVGVYQMEVESAALVRAAEDILSLTRVLKESWLFGKLHTVGTSDAEKRAEAAAAKVAEGLARLQAKDGSGVGTGVSEGQAMELDGNNGGYKNGKDP